MDFICPVCKTALAAQGGAAVCRAGHSFDRAAAGYYNLLVGKGAGNHGDNPEMLRARAAFLSAGHYAPLAMRLSELVLEYTSPMPLLLDAGCGEGYYTDIIERALCARDGASRVIAFDISKDAARRAAKRNKSLSVAVASAYAMPIADASLDAVVNVFSPMAHAEVLRVLSRGGRFIMAYPGEEHLFSLKAAVYDTPYKNKPSDTALLGLSLLHSETVRYRMELFGTEISDLFAMTPYAYRTSEAEKRRLLSLERLEVEAHFNLLVYERTGE